jgi:hypothetical protein
MRELDTADNVNDVLVWRLRRLADLPAHTRTSPAHTGPSTAPTTAAPSRPAAPPAAPDPGKRPPRR